MKEQEETERTEGGLSYSKSTPARRSHHAVCARLGMNDRFESFSFLCFLCCLLWSRLPPGELNGHAAFQKRMPDSPLAGRIGHGLNIDAGVVTLAKSECPNSASSISRMMDIHRQGRAAASQQILTNTHARHGQARQINGRGACHQRSVNGRKTQKSEESHSRP
jgi:hypothetical protein